MNTFFLTYGKPVSFKHRIGVAFLLLTLVISAVYLFCYKPDDINLYPKCPFHELTGLHCPGCGSLRALHQLMHGNILGALDLNPLMVLFTPLVFWVVASQFSIVIRGYELPKLFVPALWIWILFIIIIVYWIIRNIPVFPFEILAP